MYIYGSFLSQQSDVITVHIVTNADRTQTLEIGTGKSGVFFTADPTEIVNEVNDTFDVLLRQSATIRLQCRKLTRDFFCKSCRDAVVNIYKNDKCVFAGFIEPQTYSQPYNDIYDEVELNCIDALSALQYSNYKSIGSAGISYNAIKEAATQCSFMDILAGIFSGMTDALDIVGGHSVRFLYDGSKAVNDAGDNRYAIFRQLTLSELLFLGEGENDVWTSDQIVEELLRYLNLHIVQEGFDFFIFSWDTIKGNADISWHDLTGGGSLATTRKSITIATSIAADCDTSISIEEIYNKLFLKCDVKAQDHLAESPLDDDSLTSPCGPRQKYMTEYSSDGKGSSSYKAFYDMTHDKETDGAGASIVEWFIQAKKSGGWMFPQGGKSDTDLLELCCPGLKNQQNLPNYLSKNPGAAILSQGCIEVNLAKKDNSPVAKINMTDYFVVSINGNGKDGKDEYHPNDDDIKKNIPYAIYNGNVAGGSLSPADEATTNYIVISGKVLLNPLMEMTAPYGKIHARELSLGDDITKLWSRLVPSRTNGDGRLYTRRYWKASTPADEPEWDTGRDDGFVPYTGKGPQMYEFKYSAIGDNTDKISKVAVLSCMLIVGDKCVVETGTQGQPSDFQWRKYKERSACADDDEYYQQSFTIGFDPKIGDKLIGTEFNIQNNINYTMGIDAEGIAIPVRKADRVSGKVRLMILGPVNSVFDDYTRRHPTFFRHTKWSSRSVPLLAHTSSIMLNSLEITIHSDNGLLGNAGQSDLIYVSDTDERFTNKKDDLEFKIHSALTAEECKALSVVNSICLSTPVNTKTGDAVISVYDYGSNSMGKPEKLYVDSYYKEYHLPRVVMKQRLTDTPAVVGRFFRYVHPALGSPMFVLGISRNLMECSAELTLKEIDHD